MSTTFNPYAKQHESINGSGDARPTALQVLEDNNLIQAWPDKVVLITGASSGIGIETARAMYATGAQIFVMVRNIAKMQPIVSDIIKSNKGTGTIEIIEMDLDSLDSVKNAARRFLQKSSRLNVLINNAGIMACPATVTVDGFERQFAVNYLAHFTLTALLLPTMISSSSPAFNSRVVWVSSSGHRYGADSADPNDMGLLKDDYEPWSAYGHSKTAMMWASNYIDRTYSPRGVHSLSLNPGAIDMASNLGQYVPAEILALWRADEAMIRRLKSAEQGAATQVWAAAAPVWEGKGGKYLNDVQVAGPAWDMNSLVDDGYGYHVYDSVKEEMLWRKSLEMARVDNP